LGKALLGGTEPLETKHFAYSGNLSVVTQLGYTLCHIRETLPTPPPADAPAAPPAAAANDEAAAAAAEGEAAAAAGAAVMAAGGEAAAAAGEAATARAAAAAAAAASAAAAAATADANAPDANAADANADEAEEEQEEEEEEEAPPPPQGRLIFKELEAKHLCWEAEVGSNGRAIIQLKADGEDEFALDYEDQLVFVNLKGHNVRPLTPPIPSHPRLYDHIT